MNPYRAGLGPALFMRWRISVMYGDGDILNFIFDIGNVLIDFKPEIFLKQLFAERHVIDKMYETIFKSREWLLLDEGTITPKEASDIFCRKEPDFHPQIKRTMERLREMLTPMSETIELLPKIKEAGHGLYYLSNINKEFSGYIQAEYQFFNLFDGGVFSCDIHSLKPSPKIYLYLLEKYGLSSKECLFFDDVGENVVFAESVGIKGVLFTGAKDVEYHLNRLTLSL